MANNKFLEETGLSRLWAHTKKLVAEVELKISCPYDVGDVLATKNPQNPSERWAGTKWQRVEGSFIVGYKAVSYTHLDVYKRQQLYSAF